MEKGGRWSAGDEADRSEDMSENATRQQLLIVDDEEVNRTILSLMFDSDYDIVEAPNGMEAIEAIEKNDDIALILLDVIMLVMDGFGVLDYMKEKDLLEDSGHPDYQHDAAGERGEGIRVWHRGRDA